MGKIGVALQVAAMVMLLSMPHLSLLARTQAVHAQPGRCAMDHRICGCSPERIASRICCCFRNMRTAATAVEPGHCDLRAKPHEHPDSGKEPPPASPRLTCLPCGQDSQVIGHAATEMKYLRSVRALVSTHRTAPLDTPLCEYSYLGPFLEPPVPPPKIFFSV